MSGTVTWQIGNEDLTLNTWDRVKELRAMNAHPYPVVDDCLRHVDKMEGGERTIVGWDIDDHSVATGIRTGYEGVMGFLQTTLQPGYQQHGIVVQPVFISDVDKQRNSGRQKVLDALKQRVDNVERHFRRQFQNVLLRGAIVSGTWPGVPGWEDFLSLNGGDTPNGIVEDQAIGTNVLHNYTKSAASPEQFHNYFANSAGDASVNTLPQLYAAGVDAQIKEGDPNPNDSSWYFSRNVAINIKSTIRPQEQYIADGNMDDGKRVAHMMYGGIKARPIAEMATTGSGSTGLPWGALRINWNLGVRFRAMPGWVMDWTEYMDLPGGVGVSYALIRLWGNLIALQPGSCALVVNAEVL